MTRRPRRAGGWTWPPSRRCCEQRLHLLPPLRWRLVPVPLGIDLPYWAEDPDFDLSFHVRETALPAPGDDRQLAEPVARIFGRPLDRGRPLWELYVIDGLTEGRVGAATKIHHSVVDGISGNEIMATLLDPEPEGRVDRPAAARGTPRRRRSPPTARCCCAAWPRSRASRCAPCARFPPRWPASPTCRRERAPRHPDGLAPVHARPPVFGSDESSGVLEVTTARPPKTPFNGPVSAHRRFAFGSLSLDAVRAIRREYGTTVNDVVVSICAAPCASG